MTKPKLTGKWEVHTKGGANQCPFEIAVIRRDNALGKRSYGWYGEDKLLITHNGGPCQWPVTLTVWNGCLRLAEEIAEKLNAQEAAQ